VANGDQKRNERAASGMLLATGEILNAHRLSLVVKAPAK